MIMDDEYDMCSYSACDNTDSESAGEMRELWSTTALHAAPLFIRSVR
jgi:hypothetical protein